MPRRAHSYKRISMLGKQAKGDGINRQEDYAERRCAREGWVLDDTLVFTDKGRSGFHGRHRKGKGALKSLLECVKSGRIAPGSVLIIENVDRLSREELDEAHDLFKSILRAGVWIATESPERLYTPESLKTLIGTIEPLLLMYLAHEESQKKSDRIADKWQRRRERVRQGNRPHSKKCPLWVEWTAEGFRLLPGRARTVATIFALAAEGYGLDRIAGWLAARPEEHPPFTPKGWTRAYVWHVLRARLALGEWQPRRGSGGYDRAAEGEPVKDYYPRVVAEDEWTRAQAALDGRRHASGRPGNRIACLFTGLVREARTGKKMHVRPFVGTRADGCPYYSYLVAAERRWGGGLGVRYENFEEAVLREIGKLRPRDVLPPDQVVDERERSIAGLERRRVELAAKVAKNSAEWAEEDDPETRRLLREAVRRQSEELRAVVKEEESLKFESVSGRGEALAETQALLDLLDKVRGTPDELDIRQRLKGSITWLVQEVWVLVQPFTRKRSIVHVQVYLRAGGRRYAAYGPERLRPGERPWTLRDCDFRTGELPPDVVRQAGLPVGA